MTKENLSQIIGSSLANIPTADSLQINEFKWKIVLNDVEAQIAIEDFSGLPSISLYFIILQLPANNRSECLEELMKAHFHTQSKYALFNDFILQIVDIHQTDFITSEYFSELLTIYFQHIVVLRNDLYSKYYA